MESKGKVLRPSKSEVYHLEDNLFNLDSYGWYSLLVQDGFGVDVLSEEQILDHLDEYEFVSWRGTELPVVGWMQSVVLGDGRPAVVEVERGKGKAFLFNFLPGLGYLKTDAPVKVVRYRRGTTGGRRTPLSWTWRRLRRCGRPWEA